MNIHLLPLTAFALETSGATAAAPSAVETLTLRGSQASGTAIAVSAADRPSGLYRTAVVFNVSTIRPITFRSRLA